jgi:hypothetical protein
MIADGRSKKMEKGCVRAEIQLPVQSVPITTKIVSSNPVHGEVY